MTGRVPRTGVHPLNEARMRTLVASRAALLARAMLLVVVAVLLPALPGSVGDPARADSHSQSMREHMREMMQGLVPPPGLTPEALPAPQSDGARLVARYCTQCHDLPSPRYKTTAQWPPVFARMFLRMRAMAGGGMMGAIRVPAQEEINVLLGYLQDNAMVEARPAELERGDAGDRVVFAIGCAVCHALPSPALHTPDEWPGVVARMQANMQLMNKPPLTDAERDAVVAFLRTTSQ